MTVPLVDGLAERKVRPDELFADTAYGSGRMMSKSRSCASDWTSGYSFPPASKYELEDAPERVEVHSCQGNMRALPLAVPLPGEAGPACGGLRPQGDLVKVNIEGRRRAEATEEWRKRYAIRAGIEVKLRAEARPRAWALAGARGPSGAACRLPQGVGVQLQADGPCTPGGDGKHGSAGGRDGTCCRSRVRAPLHNFHRAP